LALHVPLFQMRDWPASEYFAWRGRDAESPIGELRDDWRHARLCHVIAQFSMAGCKSSVADFLMWHERPAPREQTVEEAAAVMRKAAAIVRKKR